MSDPCVKSLFFRVVPGDGYEFDQPAPTSITTSIGALEISVDGASIELTQDFTTVEEARTALQPFIDGYEISSGLQSPNGCRQLRLFYYRGEFAREIDSDGKGTKRAQRILAMPSQPSSPAPVTAFPIPPTSFSAPLEVVEMWNRWEGYCLGREPLPQMAYFCLTQLEHMGGTKGRSGRIRAASQFCIDKVVLDELGNLVSEYGDSSEARKATRDHPRAFTRNERVWMETIVKQIIQLPKRDPEER